MDRRCFSPRCARPVEQAQDYEGWRKVDEVEDLRKRTYHFVGAGTMRHPFQVGDLVRAVLSTELGIVVKLNPEYVPRNTFDVKWLSKTTGE